LIQGGTEWLTASSDHSQAVVLKVSEAIGAPLNQLHFPMEAFGNAIVFGEAPHYRNSAPPADEVFSQSLHGIKLLGLALPDDAQESGNELFGAPHRSVIFVKKAPKCIHLRVQKPKRYGLNSVLRRSSSKDVMFL